ncbi:MAG: hypothetical protein V1897_06970 [Pseudomonadota bacterium]
MDWTVSTDRGNRIYQNGARRYVSVTSYLKVVDSEGLDWWRGEVGNDEADRIRDDSGRIGGYLHDCAHELHLQAMHGGDVKFLPATLGQIPKRIVDLPKVPRIDLASLVYEMYSVYQKWFTEYVDCVLGCEETVWSDSFMYAGTQDLRAVLKGDVTPSVLDLKTSNGMWKGFAMQTAGYREANLERGNKVSRRLVVRISKQDLNTPVEVAEYTQHQRDFNGFLAAISLWR